MSVEGVTVVVPHYGPAEPTRALLDALATQLTGRPVQVVVVDDCSPEPFPDSPGAVVVRRGSNGGFGAAVNTGAALAQHGLLLVLNSDLEVGATFVDDLCAAAEPWMPAVVGPAVLDADGGLARTGRHFPTAGHQVVEWLTPLARFRDRPLLHEAVGHDTRCRPGVVTPVDWLVGAVLLLPTDAFLGVGGFDEGYFMNSEEVDLQRRLRGRGIPSVYVGTAEVTHRGGGSTDPDRRRAWLVDSRMRYAATWGGERRLRAGLRAATMANLAWNGGRRMLGRPVHPLETARAELSLLSGDRR